MPRSPKPVRDSSSPAPAPWQLRAQGFLLLVRTRPLDGGQASTGCVMFVDYSQSPVGHYYELLYIPRLFTGKSAESPSIDTIYVSTQESVVGGRRNWGIPKQLASFDVSSERRTQSITVTVGTERAFQLVVEPSRLSVPFTTTLLPPRMRTLRQELSGLRYTVKPEAHGLVHTAKVHKLWSESAHFPALTPGDVLFSAQLSHVRMKFPRARTSELTSAASDESQE